MVDASQRSRTSRRSRHLVPSQAWTKGLAAKGQAATKFSQGLANSKGVWQPGLAEHREGTKACQACSHHEGSQTPRGCKSLAATWSWQPPRAWQPPELVTTKQRRLDSLGSHQPRAWQGDNPPKELGKDKLGSHQELGSHRALAKRLAATKLGRAWQPETTEGLGSHQGLDRDRRLGKDHRGLGRDHHPPGLAANKDLTRRGPTRAW